MEEETKKLASARSVFHAYWRQLGTHRLALALVIGSSVIVQAANLVAPLYLRLFFNTLVIAKPSDAAVAVLLSYLTIFASMWFLDWAARRIQDTANMYLSARVMSALFTDAFEYLVGHSYNFFISNFAGSLTHKVSKFSRSFETLFDTIVVSFFPTFLFVSGAIVILFVRNHTLGLALLCWTIVFICFQVYVARLRQPVRAARAQADTRVTGSLADAISNQSTISLFAGARFEENLFGHVVSLWRKATLRSWYADAWIWSGIGLFMLVIEIGLFYGGIIFWKEGALTLGDFVLIQAYLMTTFDRLVNMNRELRRVFDAFSDASEMVYILELPHEISDSRDAKPLAVGQGGVAFVNVDFYFNESRAIFQGFNVSIEPGEKIALVGPSGAGKSTITKLLLRLYEVARGSIEIDGQNIAKVTQESLRQAISFVPQEPILFHRTLMENIRYGRQSATDEEVIAAAKLAHCHEFISEFPEAYGTFVGERGVRLSGGERQRVAIARAILKNAPILVLDEATSSLDSESEALIQDALEVLMRGKTVLVIAHRLSTIMKMDRIIVIQSGKVVAQGTHQKLLAEGGLYAKLWSIQAGGFLKDDDRESQEAPEEAVEPQEEVDIN